MRRSDVRDPVMLVPGESRPKDGQDVIAPDAEALSARLDQALEQTGGELRRLAASLRRNSVALTRRQWVVVAVALATAVVGLIIAVAVRPAVGIFITSVATLTAILVAGFGHVTDNRG